MTLSSSRQGPLMGKAIDRCGSARVCHRRLGKVRKVAQSSSGFVTPNSRARPEADRRARIPFSLLGVFMEFSLGRMIAVAVTLCFAAIFMAYRQGDRRIQEERAFVAIELLRNFRCSRRVIRWNIPQSWDRYTIHHFWCHYRSCYF
jgi:hypothetical protein